MANPEVSDCNIFATKEHFFFFFFFNPQKTWVKKCSSSSTLGGSTLGPRSSVFSRMRSTPFLRPPQEGGSPSTGKNTQHCLLARLSTRVTLPIRASALGGSGIRGKPLLPDDRRAGAHHPCQKGGYPKASYLSHPSGIQNIS